MTNKRRNTEPKWWAEARKLSAPPFNMSVSAIGRILKRSRPAVTYAIDAEWRDKKRNESLERYHQGAKIVRSEPKWWAEARRLYFRDQKPMKPKAIARKLSKSVSAISYAVNEERRLKVRRRGKERYERNHYTKPIEPVRD